MNSRLEADYVVLGEFVGATLQGHACDQAQSSLELRFDGRSVLLWLARDGESVRAADAELEIRTSRTPTSWMTEWTSAMTPSSGGSSTGR
jgi:hypothetical protein